jgi:hypothetical protein
MVERDVSILRQRVENRKKIDAKWQVLLDMKDAQIQVIKEDRDLAVSVCTRTCMKVPSQPPGATRAGINDGMPSFIQNRMDFLEKFEELHEQQVAELDDARSKLAVEVASMEVVKDRWHF